MLQLRNLLNVKRIAYKNIKESSIEFYIEKCYRYYSKTYHTPLEQAYNLLPERVCQVYEEDTMAQLTADDMEMIHSQINNKVEPLLQDIDNVVTEALDDDAWIAQQNLELQKEEADKKKQAEQADIIKRTHEAIDKLNKDIKQITTKEPVK